MHGTLGTSAHHRPIVRRQNDWTLKEHEVVVSHWPDVGAIERLLPHRTRTAIQNFAGKCNLRRELHIFTTAQDAQLKKLVRAGVQRKQIAKEMGLTLNQVANRMAYTNLNYDPRPPKATGHPLVDSIRRRAFDLNISMKDLDEGCKSGAVFQKFGRGRKLGVRNIIKAAEVLGGRLTIEWEPLESDK